MFREYAKAEGDCSTRRLLLRNGDAENPIAFRLTLPTHGAFSIKGDCLRRAALDTISCVELGPGGTAALVVQLAHAHAADAAEVTDELVVRTRYDTMHVPLVAVREGQVPSGGEPTERRSAPSVQEHWDDDESDEDDRPICSSHGRVTATSAGLRRPQWEQQVAAGQSLKLTPAACTEDGELDFYQQLITKKIVSRAAPPRAAQAPPPAEHAPPPPQPPQPPPAQVRVVHVDSHSGASLASAMAAGGAIAGRDPQPPQPPQPAEGEDDETSFYRSFIAGKRQAARTEAREAGFDVAAVGRAQPSAAQVEAHNALYTCTHAHMHTRTHAHMHTGTHTHTHTCTHAHTRAHALTQVEARQALADGT